MFQFAVISKCTFFNKSQINDSFSTLEARMIIHKCVSVLAHKVPLNSYIFENFQLFFLRTAISEKKP